MATARSVPCPRCGGIFGLPALAAQVQCPFCGHYFPLNAQKLHELAQYQRQVQTQLGAANAAYRQAAQWEWTEQAMSGGGSWVVFAVFFGAAALGSVALVTGSKLLPNQAMPVLSFGFLALVMGSTVFTSLWLTGKKRRAEKAAAGVARVACPSCGAPNQLHAGQTLETCRYCGAALLPTATVMRSAVSQMEQTGRVAELARVRAERRGMAAVSGRNLARYQHYIVVGSFLPMTGGTALLWLGSTALNPTAANLRGSLALLLLAGLNAAPLVAFHARESSIRARWHAVADDLARQFRGQRLASGIRAVVDWLNAYWAAPYDVAYLGSSLYHTSAAIDACGYPGLIDIDPAGAGGQYAPRVHVLIAALVRASSAAQPLVIPDLAKPAWNWVHAAGFEVRVTHSGLLAKATPVTIANFKRVPADAHLLSTVVTTLAGLARALGAVAVPPAALDAHGSAHPMGSR